MELPKNITQIGEANHRCKIYVEDYVISYMKQLNQVAQDKDMAVSLYGIRKEENDVSYFFVYGACKLTFLQKETRHLSQAQQQEIEKLRERFFSEYTFLGYRLLNGEMIEGFHVCEQGICRYITGYAQFYEKNDSMLAYMLDAQEEKEPEVVEQEKYDVVKRRQEERRVQHEENRQQKVAVVKQRQVNNLKDSSGSIKGMRVAVVAVFGILCAAGLSTLNGEGSLEDLQVMARQVMNEAMEQQIPDAINEAAPVAEADTLIAEDKLTAAILQENDTAETEKLPETQGVREMSNTEVAQTMPNMQGSGESQTMLEMQEGGEAQTMPNMQEGGEAQTMPNMQEGGESQTMPKMQADGEGQTVPEMQVSQEGQTASTVQVLDSIGEADITETTVTEPISYTIKEGDTLIEICVRNYGSDVKVADICSLNEIENPDDIKVGQKILLP